jgi:ketosteroid isomerase-like protein
MSGEDDFQHFLQTREAAARAYVNGESGPLDQLSAQKDPATFFGPRGGHVVGAQGVAETYRRDAGAFHAGSKTHFEILHRGVSGDLGYWVGYQYAQVYLGDPAKLTPMKLRVTEIFRRERDGWKLIHRHADTNGEHK